MPTLLDSPGRAPGDGPAPDTRAPAPIDPAPGHAPARSRAHLARPVWLVLLATSLPMFMGTLDNLVMTSALPVIAAELRPSVEQLQWFVNAYTLAFAALMIPAAAAGDRWGRRRVFSAGIAVFTAGSIASALAHTPALLIAARTLQGVGAAAILPLSLTLLAAAVTPARRAMAIGIWGGVSGLGIALGPVVGGVVVEGMSWQAIFWINVPVAVVAIPLVSVGLAESRGRRRPFDLPGLVLASGAILLGVWGIVDGNDRGWGSTRIVTMLTAAAVLLVGFVWRQTRAAHPMVPLRLFAHRGFAVANAAGFLFTVGVFGAVFLLAQYLQVGQGYSPLAAGVRTLPWTAAPLVVAPVAGYLAGRVGVRPLVVGGLGMLSAALAWMAIALHADPGAYPPIVPALVLAGIGMGLTFAPLSTAVLADIPEADHATASSVNSTVREVGVALGVAVLTAVFLATDGAFTPADYSTGLIPALVVGAVVVAAAAAVAWLFRPGTGKAA